MKIIVCGGRNLTQRAQVYEALDQQQHQLRAAGTPITCVVTGAAAGADTFAESWARTREIAYRGHPAPWHTHGEYCRCTGRAGRLPLVCAAAGPWRNGQMLRREHVPSFPVGACLALPGGDGTADMVRRCTAAGIRVIRVALP